MLKVFKTTLVATCVMASLTSHSVWAEDDAALVKRVERVERIIQGQGLVSLLSRVDQLQNEVKRLNGENEALQHQIDALKERNRKLYLDLDERLQLQEAKVTAPVPTQPVQDLTVAPQAPEVSEVVPVATISQPSASQVVEQTTESAQQAISPPDAKPVAVENGEAAYQAALQTLRAGQYDDAVTAFNEFPQQYPHSNYLPNAYYWKGEAHLVLAHYDDAVASFQIVIDKFPDSRKMPDAMLKKGFALFSLGKVEESKSTLTTVMQQYPNTSAARLAKVKLDRIKQASN
jgi:tol-pal system protein YbgF